jgi:hypothetical protein
MIVCMTGFRHLVVELELTVGEQSPIEGWARAPGRAPCRFSGWSEMFAALQTLIGDEAALGWDGAVPVRPGRQPGRRDRGQGAGNATEVQQAGEQS